MHPLLISLQGGDKRSIGPANAMVAQVLAQAPAQQAQSMAALFAGMVGEDAVLAMRCADAAEKITARLPQLLAAHKSALLGPLSRAQAKEIRWHAAPMLVRLPLTESERAQVIDTLLGYTNDQSSIVKALAMQALADLALQDPALRPEMRRHIAELSLTGTPAMKARGRKLLKLLGPDARTNPARNPTSDPARHATGKPARTRHAAQ